jgi:hypothetical protein
VNDLPPKIVQRTTACSVFVSLASCAFAGLHSAGAVVSSKLSLTPMGRAQAGPGTFRAHGVVIWRETTRTAESVIAGHGRRDADVGVPQHLLDDGERNTLLHEQGCRRVAGRVDPMMREASRFENVGPLAPVTARIDRRTSRLAEDKVLVVPVISSGGALSLLLFVMRPEDGDQFRCQRNRLFPPLLDGAAAPGRRPDGSGTPSHVAGNPSGTGADHRPVCTDAAALTACSPSGNPLGKATGACPLCMQWDHRIRAATGAAEADTKYELPPGIPRRSAGSARHLVRSSTPEAWPGSRTPGTARPGTPTAGPEPLPAAARTTARSTSGRCCACGVPHPAQPVPRRPGASPFHPRLSTVDLPMRQDCVHVHGSGVWGI